MSDIPLQGQLKFKAKRYYSMTASNNGIIAKGDIVIIQT